MKNWNHLLRRAHLYLGLLLLPWLFVYGLSTFLFNHAKSFESLRPAEPAWQTLWEKPYTLEVPAGGDRLRETGRQILSDHGWAGPFGVQRQGERLVVNAQNFRQPRRLTYEPARQVLRAEQRASPWTEVAMRLHQRVGYGHGGGLNTLWAIAVDAYCLATLLWVATGLYLWWKLPVTRGWGWTALGGGIVTLAGLLATL